MRRLRRSLLAVTAAALLQTPRALACPVCYGSAEDEVLRGAELSVLFMVGITYTLLMAGAVLAVVVYRRRSRQQAPKLET